MMQEDPGIQTTWLIPYLMANDSVSVDVILMTWWSVFENIQRVIERMNMSNRYSNIISDANVWDNNDCAWF